MKVNYFKWVVASFFVGLMAVAPIAQAGLLGALVGDAVAHHEEEKAQQNGKSNMLTQHPVMGAVDGSVAGSVVEGGVIHEASDHPVLAAVGGVIAGVAATDMTNNHIRAYLEEHDGCTNDDPPYWKCTGIPKQHVLVVEAKDYYFARSEHGKELADSLEAVGEPAKDGCDPHHIVPWNEGRSWAKDYTDGARKILDECDIPIDSAQNGIWLPKTIDAKCEGAWHPRLHNKKYYKAVYNDLYEAKNGEGGSCEKVRMVLKEIKHLLENKSYEGVRPVR